QALSHFTPAEQQTAVEMISEPHIPPKTAVKMLRGLAEMPAEERAQALSNYQSDDPRLKSRAKTTAAGLPPAPDPRRLILMEVRRNLGRALDLLPKDPLAGAFRGLIEQVTKVIEQVKQQEAEK